MRTPEEFWSSVDVRGPHDCWLWKLGRNGGGYGWLNWQGRNTRAHRVALILGDAPLSADLDALHHCDVRTCCNPLHLYWGTAADNVRDCLRRGRWNSESRAGDRNHMRLHPERVCRGEMAKTSKLTREDVITIRKSGLGPAALARQFNVGPTQVGRILRGEAWTHLLASEAP